MFLHSSEQKVILDAGQHEYGWGAEDYGTYTFGSPSGPINSRIQGVGPALGTLCRQKIRFNEAVWVLEEN
jgi:hypothetical protein